MAYTKTNWRDRLVEKARTFLLKENTDGSTTLVDSPGEVYEEGTPINAENMNHMEQGIADAHEQIEQLSSELENTNSKLNYELLIDITDATTSVKTYPVNWKKYEHLLIGYGNYSNIVETIFYPTDFLNDSSTIKRLIIGNDADFGTVQIYKDTTTTISVKSYRDFSENHLQLHIWGFNMRSGVVL